MRASPECHNDNVAPDYHLRIFVSCECFPIVFLYILTHHEFKIA